MNSKILRHGKLKNRFDICKRSESIGCIVKGCGKVAYSRGLCDMHYRRCINRVRAGEITWDELERRGECIPAKLKIKSTTILNRT